jgi:hypothetical protein
VLTPEAYLPYVLSLDHCLARRWGEALCRFIMGEDAAAVDILAEVSTKMNWPRPVISVRDPAFSISVDRWRVAVLDQIRASPAEMLRVVHAWEAGMVRLMKVEKHWQQAPVPREVAG